MSSPNVNFFEFQPTHPHGVRRRTRGLHSRHNPSFNPRTRTGCDDDVGDVLCYPLMFQPTHPHGVRRSRRIVLSFLRSFNPRTRTGCDFQYWKEDLYRKSFNPRTRTGCDGNYKHTSSGIFVSTHAPARGATDNLNGGAYAKNGFNPRTRTGCDIAITVTPSTEEEVSTHAPARGAT